MSQGIRRRGVSRKASSTVQRVPAVMSLSTTAVSVTGYESGSATSQSVTITRSGGNFAGPRAGTITYGSGSGWCSAMVYGTTLVVTCTPGALATGSYSCSFLVSDAYASTGSNNQTVTVTYVVQQNPANVPVISASTSYVYQEQYQGETPTAVTFTITNSGGGTMATPTVTETPGVTWMSAAVALTGTQTWTVTITWTSSGLSAGNDFFTELVVNSTGAANDGLIVYTKLWVKRQASLVLSPTTLNFTATAGGASPPAQTVSITNAGMRPLGGAAVSEAGGAAWLTESVSSGSNGSYVMTVTPTTGALSAGTYNETLNVTDPNADNNPQTVAVSFVVSAASTPLMAVSPTTVLASGAVSGSAPASQVVTITNTSTGTLAGPAIAYSGGAVTWVTFTAPSGSGNTYTSTLSFDLTSLTAGTYAKTLVVTDANATGGTSPTNISVSLTVTAAGSYTASVATLPNGVSFDTSTGRYSGSPYFPGFGTTGGTAALPASWTTGTIVRPTTATEFQNALNAAVRGVTIIELLPGVVYQAPVGSFTCPAFSGSSGYVIVRTGSATGSMTNLPAFGTRIEPTTHSPSMATIRAANAGNARAFTCNGAGRGNLWLSGVILEGPNSNASAVAGLEAGTNDDAASTNNPYDVVVDRCWIRGLPPLFHRRGIVFNVNRGAIDSCYLSGFVDNNTDSQALLIYNCVGGLHIRNNYIEGAGENFMSGGATAATASSTTVPADVWLDGNHFRKPASWKGVYTIKNVVEFKFVTRALMSGNLVEQSWPSGQYGFGVNLKSSADFTTGITQHVTIRYNVFRNLPCGLSLGAWEGSPAPSAPHHIDVTDNLLYNINVGTTYSGGGMAGVYFYTDDPDNMVIEHNTCVTTGTIPLYSVSSSSAHVGQVSTSSRWANNIWVCGTGSANLAGWRGAGTAEGAETINVYNPGAVVLNNAVINRAAIAAQYTAVGSGWQFPTTATAGFQDYANGLYTIVGGTCLNAGSDGRSIGADIALVTSLTSGVASP